MVFMCFVLSAKGSFGQGGFQVISLPIKLEYFILQQSAPKKIDLSWKTAEQYTGVTYELQRAEDNYEFKTIAVILPPDNSTTQHVYQYSDDYSDVTVKKVLFYRIKQIKNAMLTFSEVKAFRINAESGGPLVQTFPNPVSTSMQVNVYTEKKAAVTLIANDMTGRTLFTKTMEAEEGNNTYNITEVGQISKGVFFLRVYLDGDIFLVKKIIKTE